MKNCHAAACVRNFDDAVVAGDPHGPANFPMEHAPLENKLSNRLDFAVARTESNRQYRLIVVACEYYSGFCEMSDRQQAFPYA